MFYTCRSQAGSDTLTGKTMRYVTSILGVCFVASLLALPTGLRAQERIVPAGAESVYQNFHYAPAVRVGNTLYLSGVIGGSGPPEQQFTRAFEGLRAVLQASGADLSDIVEMTTYHVDMREHVEVFMEVKDRFVVEPYPAWTAVGVETLFSPAALVEIKVVAVVGG